MIEEYDFPPELLDGVWHSTSSDRYSGILEKRMILPEPDIPDSERWGSKKALFVRSIGGVSLFDFREFDVNKYSDVYGPTWYTFVPGRWESTIWLEMDISKISRNFLCPNAVLDKWENFNKKGQIMHLIEAAHIGEIPMSMVKRVLKYCSHSDEFIEVSHVAD
jgi:hypothetical protein